MVTFKRDPGVSDTTMLTKDIREVYQDCLPPIQVDTDVILQVCMLVEACSGLPCELMCVLFVQVKHEGWGGMFIDLGEHDVIADKSVIKATFEVLAQPLVGQVITQYHSGRPCSERIVQVFLTHSKENTSGMACCGIMKSSTRLPLSMLGRTPL